MEDQMVEDKNKQKQVLANNIRTSLIKAEKLITSKRKANNRLLITGITSSAASTLVAGVTAAGGPIIGTGTEGWRIACIIAAFFGFTSTITTGIGQQMRESNQLSKGNECIGKLKSLDVAITAGSRDWEEIVNEFEDLVKIYPEFIS
jgi:hypothetical protein